MELEVTSYYSFRQLLITAIVSDSTDDLHLGHIGDIGNWNYFARCHLLDPYLQQHSVILDTFVPPPRTSPPSPDANTL